MILLFYYTSFFISIYYLKKKYILIYIKLKFCVDIENNDDGMVTDKKNPFHSNHKIFEKLCMASLCLWFLL